MSRVATYLLCVPQLIGAELFSLCRTIPTKNLQISTPKYHDFFEVFSIDKSLVKKSGLFLKQGYLYSDVRAYMFRAHNCVLNLLKHFTRTSQQSHKNVRNFSNLWSQKLKFFCWSRSAECKEFCPFKLGKYGPCTATLSTQLLADDCCWCRTYVILKSKNCSFFVSYHSTRQIFSQICWYSNCQNSSTRRDFFTSNGCTKYYRTRSLCFSSFSNNFSISSLCLTAFMQGAPGG